VTSKDADTAGSRVVVFGIASQGFYGRQRNGGPGIKVWNMRARGDLQLLEPNATKSANSFSIGVSFSVGNCE
jgi:hypothetical protein